MGRSFHQTEKTGTKTIHFFQGPFAWYMYACDSILGTNKYQQMTRVVIQSINYWTLVSIKLMQQSHFHERSKRNHNITIVKLKLHENLLALLVLCMSCVSIKTKYQLLFISEDDVITRDKTDNNGVIL